MQFNTYANTYDDNAWIQKDLIEWGLPYFNPVEFENKKLAEMGAGTGFLTEHLSKMRPQSLLATDISENMIEIGKKKIPEVQWKCLNAWQALQTPVNFICSSSLLHWAPNPLDVLQKWRQSITLSGKIHCLFFIDKTLMELKNLDVPCGPIKWKTPSQWHQIFENAKFKIELSRNEVKRYIFPSATDLLRMLKLSGTTTQRCLLPAKLLKAIKSYEQKYSTINGIISTWHFFQISASKQES